MKKIFLIAFSTITLFGCKDKISDPEKPITGKADFSTYVAIGNSVTAGFQSNSLYESAQIYSYANLIAKQVNTKFIQPTINEPGIHEYRIEFKGISPSGMFLFDKNYERGDLSNADYPLPYNNLGIPGAHLYDVLYTTNMFNCYSILNNGALNPFFDLILRNYANNFGTQFEQAKRLKPTFITLWIGNNDILGYAMNGEIDTTPLNSNEFANGYRELLDSLGTLKAKIVIANIPDVTVLPLFTAIKVFYNQNDTARHFFGQTKYGIKHLVTGSDFITLSAMNLLYNEQGTLTGLGITQDNPVPDKYVLDSAEVEQIRAIIKNYNDVILSLSAEREIVIVDIFTLFNELKAKDSQGGYSINGIILKTDFVTGGLFSFDGVHPSSRGQGIIANEFIKKINDYFDASIPLINISDIPEVIHLNSQIESWVRLSLSEQEKNLP